MNQITEWAKSRRFFLTAVIGLVFVVLRDNLGIPIDDATAKEITNSLVLWVIGESAAATSGWSELIKSPRFLALAASIANSVFKDRLGLQLPPETVQQLLTLVQTLLAGYALRPHFTPSDPKAGNQ
jgi:hypothetical protein